MVLLATRQQRASTIAYNLSTRYNFQTDLSKKSSLVHLLTTKHESVEVHVCAKLKKNAIKMDLDL